MKYLQLYNEHKKNTVLNFINKLIDWKTINYIINNSLPLIDIGIDLSIDIIWENKLMYKYYKDIDSNTYIEQYASDYYLRLLVADMVTISDDVEFKYSIAYSGKLDMSSNEIIQDLISTIQNKVNSEVKEITNYFSDGFYWITKIKNKFYIK